MCRIEFPESNNIVSVDIMKKIISKTNFHIEYSPIVKTYTGEIYAYESIGKFEYNGTDLSQKESLELCYGDIDIFYELDLVLKKEQFVKRPSDKKLFVNYDVDILLDLKKKDRIAEFLSKQNEFTIKLIHNPYKNVEFKKLIKLFNSSYNFTVENIFEKSSMLSMFFLNQCKYIIFDKDILSELKRNKPFSNIVNGILGFAHDKNRKIILKGVDTQADFKLAKSISVDYIQGRYAQYL